jgi:molybdate transport system ATP-binding protein
MTTALAVDLRATVGEFELDVAFEVPSGVGVLFGPSGAGKSLTLAMIAGLMRPDAGSVVINGQVVDDRTRRIHISPQGRRLGMVFQDGLLLPHRSVLDNVALAVRQTHGRSAQRAIAREWLDRVGSSELANRRPRSLSGGQRQRIALARALAGDPELVLLDEPLSALDLKVRRELRSFIRDVLVSSGVPAVLVTHDIDEADEIGDLIIEYGAGVITGKRPVLRAATELTADEADAR